MAQSFLLGENFVNKIRSTIDRVDGTPLPGAGGTKRPAIFEDNPQQQGSKTFRIGTFDGSWAKGSDKTVELLSVATDGTLSASGTTVTATNLFMDLNTGTGGRNATDSKCAIAKAGGRWFLVEAEAGAGAEAETECVELSRVEPSGNLTLLTGINASGSVVTDVQCVDGNLTVTTEAISDVISQTYSTISLKNLANITTSNVTLPKQGGCN